MDVKGGIFLIYSAYSAEPSEKAPYMLSWELDLEWDLDTCNSDFTRAFRGILHISLVEANLKVISLWYLVPTRLVTFFPQSSPLCFRGCDHLGTLLHVLWQCPRVRSYWNKIFNLIRKVTGIVVNQDPTIALLNRRIPKTTKYTQMLNHIMLLGAKISIARAWKFRSVSFHLTKQNISWIMYQEKTSNTILNKFKTFKCIWEPWPHHIGISL